MAGVSAIRQKLERVIRSWHFGRVYCGTCGAYDHECGCSPSVNERRKEGCVSEALALIESEPDGFCCRDNEAMERLRGFPHEFWTFEPATGMVHGATLLAVKNLYLIAEANPTDAILGLPGTIREALDEMRAILGTEGEGE